jgi:hypothetical protein
MELHQRGAGIGEVLHHRSSAESAMLQRELASIHRQVGQHSPRSIQNLAT